ncbi:hypothetical protein ACHWQZ_G009543 [Mnemiopsis leidyi]
MSVGVVLACLLLVTKTIADTSDTSSQLPRFKCLSCERTDDLMCYNNQTCGEGQKFCYYHLYRVFNYNKSRWDVDYYTNTREWGCTDSEQTCQQSCKDTPECNSTFTTCCNADLSLLNEHYSEENHQAYRRCYYGAGTRLDFVLNCHLLVLSLLILDWLVR